MKTEEALEILKYYDSQPYFFSKDASANIAFKMAIEALEKQNPKDVLIGKALKDSEDNTVFICPKCKRIIEGISFYCWHCGQKIKWGD